VPCPKPFALLERDGCAAIIFEHVPGEPPLRRAMLNPLRMTWTLAALARFHANLHNHRAARETLPCGRDVLSARLLTSTADQEQVLAAQRRLASLEDGHAICHGDLHLRNVIGSKRGWIAIDWARATVGDPAADVARSDLLIRYAAYGRAMRRVPLFRLFRHLSATWYLFCYCLLARASPRHIWRWRLPVAVAWMQEQGTMHRPGLQRAVATMTRRESRGKLA
jgi:aminoglycoside phosphotransferase (APT) family kinase protein